jgi:hypothetical protein
MFNVSIRECFSVLNVSVVCIRNTARSKSIPLLCTHVDSYKFSTVHPPRLKHNQFLMMSCRHGNIWLVGSKGVTSCNQAIPRITSLRGWSHQPIQTPFVSISGCNSVKSGGPTSIYEHNPQQFHGWNQMESLVWSMHEPELGYLKGLRNSFPSSGDGKWVF